MSKKQNPLVQSVDAESSTEEVPLATAAGTPVGTVVPTPVAAPAPKLMDIDRMALELARSRRQTALAEAKTALAQSETAELAYKYVVLQLYMKYGLTDADAVSEAGDIIKGGALQRPAQQQA